MAAADAFFTLGPHAVQANHVGPLLLRKIWVCGLFRVYFIQQIVTALD